MKPFIDDSTAFEQALQQLPPTLRSLVEQHWQQYSVACGLVGVPLISAQFYSSLVQVWAASDFVAEWCKKNPQAFLDLLTSGAIKQTTSAKQYQSDVENLLAGVTDEAHLMEVLRIYRSREMVRLAWRDLSASADLATLLEEQSALADALISTTLKKLYDWQCQQSGIPYDDKHQAQQLLIIALGKLGGRGLNFSSDVDLMFAYPQDGQTEKRSHQVFFTRLAQRLIKVLHTVTAHGMVYRVDMRLRPFGDSGPLVISFAALAAYYQEHGRGWERYALLKARIISGNVNDIKTLKALLHPFVYRRYVDFSVIDSLREVKKLFSREVRLQDIADDIKRGDGGIRQIEFIIQAFQLIHGGQDSKLQQASLLPVLHYLTDSSLIGDADLQGLADAYCFLRRLEHRLQMINDQQTHRLPTDAHQQARIACAMGYSAWDTLYEQLQLHRTCVAQQFAVMMSKPPTNEVSPSHPLAEALYALWQGKTLSAKNLMEMNNTPDALTLQALLQKFRQRHRYKQLHETASQRLNQLMPLILSALAPVDNSVETLVRLFDLLDAIMRRSAYMVLLLENPQAVGRLVKVYSASDRCADLITRYPVLLDEFIDRDGSSLPVTPQVLQDELRQCLLGVAADDVEQQMEVLRRFKHRQHLRVSMADVFEQLPLMKVSDHLTWTAEVILQQVHALANQIRVQQGHESLALAIVAYGKLGGIELSYDSDVDLVFLYDKALTDEHEAIRLVQKMIHLINIRTASGVLYKVDTRLRPSGSAGLLVSSLKAFAQYQQESAWTWEHQALVRARVISGDEALQQQFATIRQQILAQQRPLTELREQVVQMRDKMRLNAKEAGTDDDIKFAVGGMTDIEFMVQYGVLAWSWQEPALLQWTDNIRILASVAQYGLLQEEDVELLCRAYQVYRDVGHQQLLHGEAPDEVVRAAQQYLPEVARLWQMIMNP